MCPSGSVSQPKSRPRFSPAEERGARRARLDALFADAIAADYACPPNRPMDRRLRLLTVRCVPGPASADGLRDAKRTVDSLFRALARFDLRRRVVVYAYGERWGGWHAHAIIDSARIDQARDLNKITARQAGLVNVQINLLRLPGEVGRKDKPSDPERIHRIDALERDGRILVPSDFRCPEVRARLASVNINHLDYLAGQPLDAPKGSTLWTEPGQPRGAWTAFRDQWIRAFRAGLTERASGLDDIEERRKTFAPARTAAWKQEALHRDLWKLDSTSYRVCPGHGRRVAPPDLSQTTCPICACAGAAA